MPVSIVDNQSSSNVICAELDVFDLSLEMQELFEDSPFHLVFGYSEKSQYMWPHSPKWKPSPACIIFILLLLLGCACVAGMSMTFSFICEAPQAVFFDGDCHPPCWQRFQTPRKGESQFFFSYRDRNIIIVVGVQGFIVSHTVNIYTSKSQYTPRMTYDCAQKVDPPFLCMHTNIQVHLKGAWTN